MINEFSKKIENLEYISTKLYSKTKENNQELIPQDFDLNKYNEKVLERDLIKYKDYFDNMYKGIDDNIHLDEEQRRAILTDEDYSLIIAGAGTGKTTTMASKVKYLVDIKEIVPSKIAVMSFTKKATQELENRIKIDFEIPVNVTTFHSLGLAYIREIFKDHKCYVIDSDAREKIFTSYFKEQIFPYKEKIKEMMDLFSQDKIGLPWVFSKYFKENYEKYNTFDEYFEDYKKSKIKEVPNLKEFVEEKIETYLNNDEYIKTINGEFVKSKGEAIIANFLYKNGIEYEYEKIYPEIMSDNKTYKPDFTLELGGFPVYLEYFGLSTYDETSSLEMNRYNKNRKDKEKHHQENHTNFIALDRIKGENIEETLSKELLKMGFTFKPKTYEEIYDRILSNNPVSTLYPLKDFLYNLIDTVKSSAKRVDFKEIISDSILGSPSETKDIMERQYYYFKDFYIYYQTKLYNNEKEYGFDFSDMFYYAIKYMENIRESNNLQFEYIIIDEYQDISKERYTFAKKMSDMNCSKVVAVGDDWQSIFAFAGSKIKYIYEFEKYFEDSKLLKITKTYRNSNELIKYSGAFIMRNPNQIKKELISSKNISNPIKFVIHKDEEETNTLKKLILTIHKNNPKHKIMILGRTNKMIKDLFKEEEFKDGIDTKIEFLGYEDIELEGMTMHKSKGLTCDEVILIGLDNSFPSKSKDPFWIKELFKDREENENIAFAEERRLFYVALTRTKNNVYLLVNEDTNKRSEFLLELANIIKNKDEEKQVS